MTGDELRMILTYVEGQMAATEMLLKDPLPAGMERYWRHWLKQYAWWRENTQDALLALGEQATPSGEEATP